MYVAPRLTGVNHSKLSQCTDYRISRKSVLMAPKSLMARILVMAEMDDQELPLALSGDNACFIAL